LSKLNKILTISESIGFDACGISSASDLEEEKPHLITWLQNSMHGEMGYMERNAEKRVDPRELVPGAKSVISVLLNYYPGDPQISTQPPKISRYALGTDYHNVMKGMLWEMLDIMRKEFGPINGRAFVDSAPVLERAWALKAGLGWIGKNSMLINPKIGSYTFIGELIIDIELESSTNQVPNRCGTCTRCIDACPTGAIVAPYVVDARKCISYLTIEKKSPLSEDEKSSLNGWCFGCDICQEVCPWNKKINLASLYEIRPKPEVLEKSSELFTKLSEEVFITLFGDTPISRAGYSKFISQIHEIKNQGM
jgi:epoxyqueuosine reductase